MLLWGVICLIGFGVFQFWHASLAEVNTTLAVLSIIGLFALYYWVPQANRKKLLVAWSILVILGLVISIFWMNGWLSTAGITAPFISMWLVLFTLGFAYTGHYTKENAWFAAALIQILLLIGVWLHVASVWDFSYLLLGIITGIPLILMSFKY